jgi:LPS sulfotransferase NodH
MKIFSEEILINDRFSPETLFLQLHREGWKLISLQRRDRLRQAISRLKARERNVWRESGSEAAAPARKPAVRVEPAELIELLAMLDENAALQRRWLEGVPHLALVYEDDLADGSRHQETANRIFSHLGLPPAPTKADIIKQGSRRLADDIENPAEVAAALLASPFAQYADDLN